MRLTTAVKIVAVLVVAVVVTAVAVLLSIDFNQYKGQIAALVHDSTGREVTIGGDLELDLLGGPALSVHDVTLANAPWGSRPEMARFGELAAEVEVLPLLFGGNLRVKRFVLRNGELLLETDAGGRGNWEMAAQPQQQPTDAGMPTLPDVDRLLLENVALVWRDGVGGGSTTLQIEKLAATAPAGRPVTLEATLQVNGLPVSLAAETGPLADLLQPSAPWPVSLDIATGDTKAAVKGRIGQPLQGKGLDLTVDAESDNLQALGVLVGAEGLPTERLRLHAQVSGDATTRLAVSELQAALGAAAVAGEAALAITEPRPKLTAKLTSAELDLRPFTAGAGGDDQSATATGAEPRLFSDQPLPFDALGVADADIELKVGRLITGAATLDDLAVQVVLADRTLDLKTFTAGFAGGRLQANASIKGGRAQPAVSVAATASKLDLGALQPDDDRLLQAPADAELDVSGQGNSMRAIMASLSGRAGLTVGEGTINNRYVDLIAADVLTELAPWAPGREAVTLNCMVGRFDIRQGVARADGLLLDTGKVTVQGNGSIDLGAERLDLTLKPRPKDASLVSLAVPINIGGTLLDPTFAPDSVAVATGVAGAVLGTAINPLGVLVPLVSGGSGDKNPCLAALQSGASAVPAQSQQPAAQPQQQQGGDQGGVGGLLKGLGRSLDQTLNPGR